MAKMKGSPTLSSVNPQAIFRQAACFDYATELLTNDAAAWINRQADARFAKSGFSSIEMPKEDLFRNPALAPAVVVQAFTTELYLKCLLARDACPIPQRHELLLFFQNLSPARQTRIEKLYEEECGTDALMQRLSQTDFAGKKFTITQSLTEMNIAFVQWRYAYEQPGPNNDVVGRPWVAIRTHILELEPEWFTEVTDLGIRPTSTGRS